MEIKNFTFQELVHSDTAKQRNINNIPADFEVIRNLVNTAEKMQEVRDFLGHPITITSGFRCKELNHWLAGSRNSQHIEGEAIDFICPGFGSLPDIAEAIITSGIEFDQLILEPSWIHISFSRGMQRNQTLTYTGGVFISGIVK